MAAIVATSFVSSMIASGAFSSYIGYRCMKQENGDATGDFFMFSPFVGIASGGVGLVGKSFIALYNSGIGVNNIATVLGCGVASVPAVIGGALIGTFGILGLMELGSKLMRKKQHRTYIDQYDDVYQELIWNGQDSHIEGVSQNEEFVTLSTNVQESKQQIEQN